MLRINTGAGLTSAAGLPCLVFTKPLTKKLYACILDTKHFQQAVFQLSPISPTLTVSKMLCQCILCIEYKSTTHIDEVYYSLPWRSLKGLLKFGVGVHSSSMSLVHYLYKKRPYKKGWFQILSWGHKKDLSFFKCLELRVHRNLHINRFKRNVAIICWSLKRSLS